jgi:hypothetical protein
MADTTTRAEVPAEWLEALAESEAQLAAGQVVPLEPVMQRIRDSIARLEAKQAGSPSRKVTPRR